MKDSEVYLRAAELCASNKDMLAGFALEIVSPNGWKRLKDDFYFWFDGIYLFGARREAFVRSLCLCFMAAIAKSEGR